MRLLFVSVKRCKQSTSLFSLLLYILNGVRLRLKHFNKFRLCDVENHWKWLVAIFYGFTLSHSIVLAMFLVVGQYFPLLFKIRSNVTTFDLPLFPFSIMQNGIYHIHCQLVNSLSQKLFGKRFCLSGEKPQCKRAKMKSRIMADLIQSCQLIKVINFRCALEQRLTGLLCFLSAQNKHLFYLKNLRTEYFIIDSAVSNWNLYSIVLWNLLGFI